MFIDILESECHKKGISASMLCDKLKIARTSLQGWRRGGEPHYSTICKIAEYLNVSPQYLQGIEDVIPLRVNTINEDEKELLRIFNNLDTKGRTILLAKAYELEEKNGKL